MQKVSISYSPIIQVAQLDCNNIAIQRPVPIRQTSNEDVQASFLRI